MTTWLEANRLANLAAAQAHGDLGIDTSAPQVDVYSAIGGADVLLMWRPMPRQFGAYIAEPGSRPGILVNNGLPFAAQRQTASHEFGHHRLGHGTRIDTDLEAPSTRRVAWTPQEKAAEAFGAWFLMPRKAVMAGLARLGLDRPVTPLDVYRLSLLLGTPYLATVRHLPSLRLASQNLANAWARVPPAKIKAGADPAGGKPRSRGADVWLITSEFAGLVLTVHPGDRLVIVSDTGYPEAGHPEWLERLPVGEPASRRISMRSPPARMWADPVVLEVPTRAARGTADVTVAGPADGHDPAGQWAFTMRVERTRSGIARRWVS
jgi:IrrE N-terminal-like domain